MSFPKDCCTLPPVQAEYTPKGSFHQLNDFEYYSVGSPSDRLIIGIYDLFGSHNNFYQFADVLAKANYHVIIPDVFRKNPWPIDDFPPKDFSKVMEFVTVTNSFENRVKKDIEDIMNKYNKKPKEIGLFGFCYGGKVIMDALKTSPSLAIAGAAIHPGGFTEQDFEQIQSPLLFIPTSGEKDKMHMFNLLPKEILKKSEIHDFTHTFHGFAGSRGDLNNESIRNDVDKVMQLIVNFFKKQFN